MYKRQGCVDGLVLVDLLRLKPAKRARYLGQGHIEAPEGGDTFLKSA